MVRLGEAVFAPDFGVGGFEALEGELAEELFAEVVFCVSVQGSEGDWSQRMPACTEVRGENVGFDGGGPEFLADVVAEESFGSGGESLMERGSESPTKKAK